MDAIYWHIERNDTFSPQGTNEVLGTVPFSYFIMCRSRNSNNGSHMLHIL